MHRFLPFALFFPIFLSVARSQEKKPDEPNPLLLAMEQRILYHPRKYAPERIERFVKNGKRLDYKTSQGAQTAWLISAESDSDPEKVWIVCAGNGSLALDFESLCRSLP